MDYILLFLFGWMVLCAPAIIVTVVANRRRRGETAELNDKVASLSKQLEALERRTRVDVAHVQPEAQPASAMAAMKISAEETRVTAAAPVREPVVPKQPAPWVAQPPSAPVVAPTVAAHTQPPAQSSSSQSSSSPQSKPVEAGGVPFTPASRTHRPVEAVHAVTPPPPPLKAPAITPAAVTVPPLPAAKAPEAARAMASSSSVAQPPMPGMIGSARVSASTGSAGFNSPTATQPIQPAQKSAISVEEKLGTNWLPKLGIAIVVIGVGFLVAAKWGGFAPWLRVVILYLGGMALLAGGIFAERKERYRTLGRALIGGGWAVTVLVTYGLRHAPFMAILSSNALDLVLLFGVIGVMVWHTLKYDSQLVTGASFLLGFAAITLNPDPPYNLLAGALLVAGMTVLVLRRRWFELEIFGILASYLNHFYWLYSVFNAQETRAPFPQLTISILLMIGYWALFRCSYVWRKVQSREEESVSTIAGLLNPLLFLGVMKYQSFHPEWAFYALLGMGAAEFVFGELPVSRRRVAPFRVLSSLGAALMAAAIPFKYSGNSLEMLWLAGGEAFLMAGIFVRERLFRGFGLIISSLVALYVMVTGIPPLLQEVMNAEPHHHSELGIGLAVIAAVLYANANIIGLRWKELFQEEIESQALRVLSFAASLFAVCSIHALVGDNAIAIVLALLVFSLCLLGKQFSIGDLIYQAHWIAVVAFVQTIVTGRTLETSWHGVPERVLMFVPVAGLLYVSARFVRLSETLNKELCFTAYSWAATSLLAILIWFQSPDWCMPLLWIGLGLVLGLAARRWMDRTLVWQTHALSLLAAGWTLYASFAPQYRGTKLQLISVALTAGALYLLNWITNIAEVAGNERIPMAYSWAGSLLLSWLIWYQLPPIDVSLVWGVFGLALFMIGDWKSWSFLRIQAYVALTCSFAHIFYANFNVLSAPDAARPEVLTVIPLVGIYFFVYWQLHGKKTQGTALESKVRIDDLVACLGTATLAALGRFELPAESVAIGYAALVIATLLAARFTRLQVFIYQALALLGAAAFRLAMNNFYHLREAFGSNLSAALWTIGVLAAGVPICLSISRNNAQEFRGPHWLALLAKRCEQPMFFVPFVLMAVLLALKLDPGMITLAWGAEAVVVFVLALWAKERSFRLAGLGLLLLAAAKMILWDVWQLNDPTARYLTLIGVGLLILTVSYLISRNREALREYL